MRVKEEALREFVLSLGFRCLLSELNIMGLRGCSPTGKNTLELVPNIPDRNNDTLILFGNGILMLFRGSVDPGAYYTERPLNMLGAAHIMDGQYKYKRGMHRKKYPAVTQAEKVRVWRDHDKDHLRGKREIVESGWFGINIHAGSVRDEIGKSSAGCLNIAGGWNGADWKKFKDTVYGQEGQQYFRLTVAEGGAFAAHVARTDPKSVKGKGAGVPEYIPLLKEMYAEAAAGLKAAEEIKAKSLREEAVKVATSKIKRLNDLRPYFPDKYEMNV